MTRSAAILVRPGLALIEVLTSVVVAGLMLIAALELVAWSRAAQLGNAERARALGLATLTTSEAMAKAFAEPDEDPGDEPLGPDDDETTRSTFDDVDDYHLLDESPPLDAEGIKMGGFADDSRGVWRRTVTVEYVSPTDARQKSLTPTAAKLITVTVERGGRRLASLTTVRTQGAPR